MNLLNFDEKLRLYAKSNPSLTADFYGSLLLIDLLYHDIPEDIGRFRKLYTHLDPTVIDNSSEGIMFLEIAESEEPETVIKHRLNNYINTKFNYLRGYKTFKENMVMFRQYSREVSDMLDEVLQVAGFPADVTGMLRESKEVKECTDFYDMLQLYKEAKNHRIKYEILRKIGLIVLVSRINRSFLVEDIDFAAKEVDYVFRKGLGLEELDTRKLFLWVDEHDKARYSFEKRDAFKYYQETVKSRARLAKPIHSMQVIQYMPYKSRFNTEIMHMEIRNKIRKGNQVSRTSFMEKILRKNLEFPNQVHDVIGIKLVVGSDEEIPQLVRDLSSFLGGSSTRKKEKNFLNKFGKKQLSKYSGKEYFVWKAVYDISLPHPSIIQVQRMIAMTRDNKDAQRVLRNRLKYFQDRPQDFVVEVQIQDVNSYLLGIASGSTTDHALLKRNQVRQNSVYKLFPEEIYHQELLKYRNKILEN